MNNWGSFQTISGQLEEGILVITINRPDKMNALNKTVLEEIEQAFIQIKKEAAIQGIILTGSGEKAFVAGADISEFKGIDALAAMEMAARGQRIFERIEKSKKIGRAHV